MRKAFLLLFVIAAGCTEVDLDEVAQQGPMTRISGDQKFDVLGYGYDITGKFGASSAKNLVIDVEKLVAEHSDWLEEPRYHESTMSYEYGSDISELTRKLGGSVSTSNPKVAKSDDVKSLVGFDFSANSTYTYVSNYSQIYATSGTLLKKLDLKAELDQLKGYIKQQFFMDTYLLSPDKLIEKYGTHVLANVHLGGVLRFIYQSKTIQSSSESVHKAGFQFNVLKIFGLNFGQDYSVTEARKNTRQVIKFQSFGGVGSLSLTTNIDKDGNVSQVASVSKWLESINETNSVMIGADPDKVYPIYEFVPESKRDAVKQAYEKYLESKVFTVVNTAIPLPNRQISGLGNSNQGGGVIVTDVDKNGCPDIILMGNNDATPNRFWYWVLFNVDSDGSGGTQSQKITVPKSVSNTNYDAAMALGDINRNGKDDIVFLAMDHGSSSSGFRFVIGWDLKPDGNCTSYSNVIKVANNMGTKAHGVGVALHDINGNGILDMVLMHYDAPSGGQNQVRYKILYDLATTGASWAGESEPLHVPQRFSTAADGAGISIANIDNDPRPDMIVTVYDDPTGENNFRYMVLKNLDNKGVASEVRLYYTGRGCGIAGQGGDGQLCDLDGNGIPDMIFMCIDDTTPNRFRYFVGHDLDTNGELLYIR